MRITLVLPLNTNGVNKHICVDKRKHVRDNGLMDTKNICLDLLGTGLTQQELADLVPCAQSTINAFVNGKRGVRPSYPIGSRLTELHQQRVLAVRGRSKRKKT